ncbi:MAG: glyoxalase [Bacteroidota bacterium]
MNTSAISIRPFIGAKEYEVSRSFYRDLGFQETVLSPDMSVFKTGNIAFYLQKAYVKDWIDNSMIFVEVADVDLQWKELSELDLAGKYEGVRLTAIRNYDWGRECFLHDPSGILWHFGQFSSR